MNLFKNLHDDTKKFHIVEYWKWYFIISGVILLTAIILIATIGLKLGVDFSGGYSLEVKYNAGDLTSDNYDEKYEEIRNIVENLEDKNGTPYGIKINMHQRQGGETSDSPASILIRFKAFYEDESEMQAAMEDVQAQLQTGLHELQTEKGLSGKVQTAQTISGSISSELLLNAIAAIILSITLMLIYVMFRFEFISGIAAITCLMHDVLMMFAYMVFSRSELNATFIAAMITIVGYSINNTLVIFDRLRSNLRDPQYKSFTKTEIVNKSLKESLFRTLNTSITTLVTITLLAVFGVPAIREFALPIIVGLVMGTYSSYCLAPSIWALWSEKKAAKKSHNQKGSKAVPGGKASEAKKA